jgi:hypothetical protein
LLLNLLEFAMSEHLPAFDGFDEPLGHLHNGFRIVRSQGEEVLH